MTALASAVAKRRLPARWIAAAVKLAVTLVLLGVLGMRAQTSELLDSVRRVDMLVIFLATGVLFCLSLSTTLRWRLLLRRLNNKTPSFPALWRYTLIGSFFNQVLPSGLGGDAFRIWYLKDSAVPATRGVASVMADRLLGVVALALVVLAGAPFVIPDEAAPAAGAASALFASLLGAFAMGLLAAEAWRRKMFAATRFPNGLRRAKRVVIFLDSALEAVRCVYRAIVTWPDGAAALTLSVCNQLAVGLVVYLLIDAAGGRVPLIGAIVVALLVVLISMLPISLGGWGVREGGMVIAFGTLGVPAAVSLTASVLFGICLLVASLPGLFLWLGRRVDVDR